MIAIERALLYPKNTKNAAMLQHDSRDRTCEPSSLSAMSWSSPAASFSSLQAASCKDGGVLV